MVKVTEGEITDFKQDEENANIGTAEGQELLEESIEGSGFGRSVLATADNVLIAGNKTQKAAIARGLKKTVVVETEGDAVIVHKRTDLKSTDPEARRLALADNRVGEVNLLWDMQRVRDQVAKHRIDASSLWNASELNLASPFNDDGEAGEEGDAAAAYDDDEDAEAGDNGSSSSAKTRDERMYHFTFDVELDEAILVQQALEEWEGSGQDRNAFVVQLAEIYLTQPERV
jgi:hypothetical protein